MSRIRAAAIHLAISAVIAAAVFLFIFLLWFPDALLWQAGERKLLLLIAGVHVAIGPLLMLIVFVPGKKGMAFDIFAIAFLQATALTYGAWVLFESRPAYIVFVKDRFELVRANEIPGEELDKARSGPYAALPLTGPRLVGVRFPKDPDEQFRIMMSALGGTDIHFFPRYYVAYEESRRDVVLRAAPFARLRELNPQSAAAIDGLVAKLGLPEAQLRFLPMRAGRHVDLTVVVDASRGDVLKIAALRPWEYK